MRSTHQFYEAGEGRSLSHLTIQFARGCPYTCEFCDIIVMYGRRPRTKSVPRVLAEVSAIHRLGIGNKKDAKALLAALADWQRQRGSPPSS